MGIKPAELMLIAAVLAAGLLFVMPMAGIPRAIRRANNRKRSLRGVVFASIGTGVATLGLVSGAMNWFFCLLMAALNGCWLGASLWANSKAVGSAAAPAKSTEPAA